MRRDILSGAFFPVLIMYFIILTTDTILHNNRVYDINTVEDAASALKPLAEIFPIYYFHWESLAPVF